MPCNCRPLVADQAEKWKRMRTLLDQFSLAVYPGNGPRESHAKAQIKQILDAYQEGHPDDAVRLQLGGISALIMQAGVARGVFLGLMLGATLAPVVERFEDLNFETTLYDGPNGEGARRVGGKDPEPKPADGQEVKARVEGPTVLQ